MDGLRAIGNDYALLGGKGLRWSTLRWGSQWSIFRCTVYPCPYCRWIFKITWGPFNSLPGTGERACWHCKQVFWDGSNGWPEMSSEDRYSFVLPITIGGYLAAVLVIAGLVVYDPLYFKMPANRIDLTVAGCFIGAGCADRGCSERTDADADDRSERRRPARTGKGFP